MDVSLFDYYLPPELIAQEPAEPRDAARLLVVDRGRPGCEDRFFRDLPELLRPGDCLIANQSSVIPARLLGAGEADGRPVELLMLRPVAATRWEALVRPGRRCRVGARVIVAGGAAHATVVAQREGGVRVLDVDAPWPVRELLERHGLPPLPHYIVRDDGPRPEDRLRYQTVYARDEGSVAAPTAGLHFTEDVMARLTGAGVELHYLTLHVGPGTFRPPRAERVESHLMEPEETEIPEATARAVNRARAEGRRVIAVGTTTTRALEWAADADGGVNPSRGAANLYIFPGYRFKVIDGLITNFHLPRSGPLLLVAAFAGRELLLEAYAHAITERYRFYSYGDAMLIA
ncbi:MAG TPA: tRNA preQ1(34) S-adenosylmethionine ribosyltransferase-isomerase QueA [Methylomirabilota bacterium]|jgi:S-adenosylmethionine:tRNA ribosyltransferase-isomerase|nr:tRNA preQ1(34) S-adenosylmethionine ribosyltransferase-isomerase QueA [Methylomirabilota bacterium]